MDKKFTHLIIQKPAPFVANVQLNRPDQRNALNYTLWHEIGEAFNLLSTDPDIRVIILTGNGKSFCAGLDLKESQDLLSIASNDTEDAARRGRKLLEKIKTMQKAFTLIEECPKPVIAAVHGHCVGGGIDVITACDIRYASTDAVFSVKEVDIGLAADTGTLNRLPKIGLSDSWVRELSYTGRLFGAKEALEHGLVSKVFDNQEVLLKSSLELASIMAQKSPVALQGTKVLLNYSRDHSIDESLKFTAAWNMSQLLTDDIGKAAMATISKQGPPKFSKL
uniref:Delta(3,5)-Delta(2,4)-dienoyl-CoA isomerase, mitochondrial n=1 Tax=Acrobeloides nanus TaxID=290746 RepID=A0A914DQG0_9BILA